MPAVLGAMGLVRVKAARLGLIGGVLMIAGYICYFAMLFQGFATNALAQRGGASADHIAVQDLMMNQGFPRWAAALVLVWPVAHVLGGPPGEVVGAAVEAVGWPWWSRRAPSPATMT